MAGLPVWQASQCWLAVLPRPTSAGSGQALKRLNAMINLEQLFSRRSLALAALALPLCSQTAGAFDFAAGDLVIGMRQPGGTYELIVNLGAATNFESLYPNTTIMITSYSKPTLEAAFSDLAGVKWSVCASWPPQQGPIENVLWATRPRANPNTQTVPWVRETVTQQGPEAQRIYSVGIGGESYGGTVAIDGLAHTASAIRFPAGHVTGYSVQVGASGNWQTSFQGVVESTTPADFVTAQKVTRCDLYRMDPAPARGPASVHLGYFELKWDGTMTFTSAGPAAPSRPTLSIGTGGQPSTRAISFPSQNGVSYNLLRTGQAGLSLPLLQWTQAAGPLAGTGGNLSFQVPADGPDGFFTVSAANN